jgi:hypothetical protein
MLTARGPHVIDLGVARDAQRSTMTMRGTRVGTFAFMAPEQAEGTEVTSAADVFALGCLLAYAATGVEPFSGADGSLASTLYRVVHSEPDEKALACENKQLRALIKGCLAKDPAQRPTAEQVLESSRSAGLETDWTLPPELAALADRFESQAHTLVGAARRRRNVRRAWAATAAVLLALGTAAGLLLGGGQREHAARGSGPVTSTAGQGAPRSATPSGVKTDQGAANPPSAPSATVLASPTNTALGGPVPLSPGPSAQPSEHPRYSFDCGTDLWGRVSGDTSVGFSAVRAHDGSCSLTINDTSSPANVPAVAAVTGLSDGPAAGTLITAWIYVPGDTGQTIRAALYITDSSGLTHVAAAVTVRPSGWYQLSYMTAGYSGAATSVGLRFTKSGTASLTVYLDEVAW